MTTETPAGREPMNAARRAWNADPSLDQWEAFDAGWKAHAMYHQGREDGRREVVALREALTAIRDSTFRNAMQLRAIAERALETKWWRG